MSHDNWERLVRAVMRDEENRRIALWSSMESISYISSASSSFRASSTYNSPIVNGSFSFSPTFEFPAVSPNDHETMAISEPQKVVLKLEIHDEKGKQKAMRAVSRFSAPLVMTIYKPTNITKSEYKHRTIQRKESSTQLRMLACFHGTRNIPTLINLMEISRGTGKRGGLHVYAMHIMEISERSSAILMAHKARNNGMLFWRKGHNSDKNQIVVAFEAFQHLSQVSVRPMTAISTMSSVHVDICESALRKRPAIIILPFHKHRRVDGHLETTRGDLRYVNRRVLNNAPCSVAILVDRGLGGLSHVSASNVAYVITVLFFGGQDDRESLSYGALMAKHPGITLNVVRFIVDPNVIGDSIQLDMNSDHHGEETKPDEEFLKELKERVSSNDLIKFEDNVVRDAAEMVNSIRTYSRCNLFLVGRMSDGQLVEALNKKGECPELGPVANLLISADFSTTASVLVVQQYRSKLTGDSLSSPNAEDMGEYTD